ncbi:MAG: hypothetical protein LBP94_00175, partial [Zoogloeaceae bacterium]|nr:hypothetical protein [Zoogloeaceae bacterium]
GRPYGVCVHPFNPRAVVTLWALLRLPRPDLVVIPAENRYSLLARALGGRWIVAFEGDSPAWKNWLVDELRPYPATPTAWPDMAATLIDGPPPPPFRVAEWPVPPCRPFDLLPMSNPIPTPALPLKGRESLRFDLPLEGREQIGPYCVLHVGASSPLRHWIPANWRAVADWLHGQGYHIIWSGGKGEEDLVRQCDPEGRYPSCAGQLDLAQLWHLLAHAALLVSPDTGVAHLGKVTDVPCVTLFGPGSALIYGPNRFWASHRYRAVTMDTFPCRDARMLFERTFVPWVRNCSHPPSQCPSFPSPRCMSALTVEMVQSACREVLAIAQPIH